MIFAWVVVYLINGDIGALLTGSKGHGQNGDKGDSWCLVLLPIVNDICMIYGALQYCILFGRSGRVTHASVQ